MAGFELNSWREYFVHMFLNNFSDIELISNKMLILGGQFDHFLSNVHSHITLSQHFDGSHLSKDFFVSLLKEFQVSPPDPRQSLTNSRYRKDFVPLQF